MPLTFTDIARKVAHIFVGLGIVAGVHAGLFGSHELFWVLALFVAGAFAARALPERRYRELLWRFEKDSASWIGQRAVFFLLGVTLSLELFPRDVALAAITILALGDGISGLVGPFGRIRTPLSSDKLLEGTLAGAAIAAVVAAQFVPWPQAAAAAFIAMLFEATEIRMNQRLLDDNLTVPLAAGTVILLIRSVFPAAM